MKKFLIIIICFIALNSNAQNLVINPSFENTIPCWIFINLGTWQMQCTNWYSASGGSPDYFSETYDPFCYASPVPLNQGGFQYARTGIAYVGLGTFVSSIFPNGINRREYIGGELSDTLKQGHKYCVSFYVSVAEELKYVTDGIGLYLSIDSAVDYNINTNLPFVPQISNPSGNIIYDTLNWVQISGTYIANGGEKYFTIGNFKDDANTMIDSINNNVPQSRYVSYLFIDDVSVIDCTVGINEIESYKNKIKLMPNPAKDEAIYLNRLGKGQSGVVKVYNGIGIKLAEYLLYEGDNRITIDLQKISQGVYFVETKVNDKTRDVRKLAVIK